MLQPEVLMDSGEGAVPPQEHHDELREWVAPELEAYGLGDLVGLEVVHDHPWSIVYRVVASRGCAYLKSVGAGASYEPRLVRELAETWTDLLPPVLGVDPERGWLLLGDAGMPLAKLTNSPEEHMKVWGRVLPRFVELQAQASAHVDDLLSIGIPDRSPAGLPDQLRGVLAGEQVPGGPLPMEVEDRQSLEGLLSEFEEACARLDDWRVGRSLDHGDLHASNVLVGDYVRLSDWGDASVAHPFCSLTVTYQLAIGRFADDARGPMMHALRTLYLRAWAELVGDEGLDATFMDALWVGHIVRTLDWVAMLRDGDTALVAEWRPHIAQLLRRWGRHHSVLREGLGALQGVLWEAQP